MRFNVLCLMGPTASGKTDLSLQLAEVLPCEIISVDSAMIYQGMDIGTAKPTLEERGRVRHHLIDITTPENPYSAAKFQEDALNTIHSIKAKGKIPLLVGGTMLYFKALQQGLSLLPAADEAIRRQLSEEGNLIGWEKMHARLATIDTLSALRISPTDPQRIQRALEVYEITGKPLSVLWQTQNNLTSPFDYINLGVSPLDRDVLHARIAERFSNMLTNGFMEEVETLYRREELHINLPSMRSVGYRQAWQYLEGNLSYEEFCDKGIAATRQLAKRQLTWLRHWEGITWFDSCDRAIFKKITLFLEQKELLQGH